MPERQKNQGCRKYHRMQDIETMDRCLAVFDTPQEKSFHALADERHRIDDTCSDNRCPVCPLIPNQKISGKGGTQNHQPYQSSNRPPEFEFPVFALPKAAQKMAGHQKDQDIGRPVMCASHQAAKADIVCDMHHGLIGRRRPVVKGQQDAACHGEKEEGEGCSAKMAN